MKEPDLLIKLAMTLSIRNSIAYSKPRNCLIRAQLKFLKEYWNNVDKLIVNDSSIDLSDYIQGELKFIIDIVHTNNLNTLHGVKQQKYEFKDKNDSSSKKSIGLDIWNWEIESVSWHPIPNTQSSLPNDPDSDVSETVFESSATDGIDDILFQGVMSHCSSDVIDSNKLWGKINLITLPLL